MTAVLLLKLCLVPSLIWLVTPIGRRWGPNAAGPILLTMALEQGSGFVATAAAHTLIAVIAVLVFCLAFGLAAGAALVVQVLGRRGVPLVGRRE